MGRLRLLSSLGSAAPRPLRLGLLAGATEKRYRARAVRCAAPFCDLMRPFAIAVRSGLHAMNGDCGWRVRAWRP